MLSTLLLGLVLNVGGALPVAENVVVIVSDGLRAREVFDGAERALMTREVGGVENESGLVAKYWRPSREARREALMPFIWHTVATQGQLLGDAALGSSAKVTNGQRLSYPGYNEMFTGAVDPRIDSNEFDDNPNPTVLEWLGQQPGVDNRVQAIATWDTFFRIFNVKRSGLEVKAGWYPPFADDQVRTPGKDTIDAFYANSLSLFGGNGLDAYSYLTLKESLKEKHPKVLFLGLGETDEWMHAGRYDMALEAAHRADAFIGDLWATMQAMPEYAGKTTFIITTDHGRGAGLRNWKNHESAMPGAEDIWVAAIGPTVPSMGSRSGVHVTLSQVAASVGQAIGYDWRAQRPDAAAPIDFAPVERHAAR